MMMTTTVVQNVSRKWSAEQLQEQDMRDEDFSRKASRD